MRQYVRVRVTFVARATRVRASTPMKAAGHHGKRACLAEDLQTIPWIAGIGIDRGVASHEPLLGLREHPFSVNWQRDCKPRVRKSQRRVIEKDARASALNVTEMQAASLRIDAAVIYVRSKLRNPRGVLV